ncbi:hypothetical protein BGZ94_000201 [Podila epigama]|nr:hypothetical protein BGZ94_000201 [Podila epigama]
MTSTLYRKQLDSETIQAIVPIGHFTKSNTTLSATTATGTNTSTATGTQTGTATATVTVGQDSSLILAMNLCAEQEPKDEAENRPIKGDEHGLCWKYHNIITIHQKDLDAQKWERMTATCHVPASSKTKVTLSGEDDGKEDDDEDNDSDDDYWGQYNDNQDSESSEQDQDQPKHSHSHKGRGGNYDGSEDEDEDEDEYWRKYAQQQEKESTSESSKKKLNENTHALEGALEEALGGAFGGALSPAQVDTTMLSSLMQTLVLQSVGGANDSLNFRTTDHLFGSSETISVNAPIDDSLNSLPASRPTFRPLQGSGSEQPKTNYYGTASSTSPMDSIALSSGTAESTESIASTESDAMTPPTSSDMVSITLQAAVQQATLARLTKEQVFAMLEQIYSQSTSSSLP